MNCDQENANTNSLSPMSEYTNLITIRSHTGLSGDMLLTGFASLLFAQEKIVPDSEAADNRLSALSSSLLPELAGVLKIRSRFVNNIYGLQAQIDLPHCHEHRNLQEIISMIEASSLPEQAKKRATNCFQLLAECEAACHGISPEAVHFHEVGALDSILDICLVCSLYEELGAPILICSPLPLADGIVGCCHGLLPAPAPAVLRLLAGVAVKPFAGDPNAGELVTPTALALLQTLNASYGLWPAFRIIHTQIVYGQREFADTANGVIFAYGTSIPQ